MQKFSRRSFLKMFSVGAVGGLLPMFPAASKQTFGAEEKMLILYFSHSGNTRNIANFIRKAVGCDTFRLIPATPYPDDYNTLVEVARQELRQNKRPPFSGTAPDFSRYGTIFIGYPNWWGTLPMIFSTLFDQTDLNRKTLIPFVTHEGSGFGRSIDDLQKRWPQAKILEGLAVRGSQSASAEAETINWLKAINIL